MNKKVLFYIILIILLVLVATTAFLFYNHMSKTEEETKITEPYSTETELADILSNRAKERRDEILQGPYGQMSPKELVEATIKDKGQEMRLALVIRKVEVLPVIKEKLQFGSLNEKSTLLTWIQDQLRWPELISFVELIIQDDDLPDLIRGRAAIVLANFQHYESISDTRNLLATAESENLTGKLLAMRSLAILNDKDSEYQFEAMLNDPSPFIQVTAATCLGMLGSDVGLETVITLSNDDYFGMRRRAAEALSYINTPVAREKLYQMRENDPSTSVQSECAIYIDEMELAAIERKEALKQLKEMFDPDNFSASQGTFMYMVDHFGVEAIDTLQELSESEGPFQNAAIISLLEINSGVVTISEIRRRDR